MTSVVTLKKEVKKIREKAFPEPKDETWVVFWAPPDDDEDTDVEVIGLYSGIQFKCKYGDYKERLKEAKALLEAEYGGE